jgi:uncharacterized membrane protein YkgB
MSNANLSLPHLKRRYENGMVLLLRISIALVFIWFGLLKMLGFNPVFDLVSSVIPSLAVMPGLALLGWFEVLIGLGVLLNKFRTTTHLLLLAHLAGTFIPFFTAPKLMFAPFFPILSLAGEFVMKNIILAIAGLVVLLHESHRRRTAAQ